VFNEPLEKIIGDFKAAGLVQFPAAAAKFSWIACDNASRRSSDEQRLARVMDVAHRLALTPARQ
jgi:hypothetical protein